MPHDKDSKIPRIPWKGSRSTESTELPNQQGSLELIKEDRKKAEDIVAAADYVEYIAALGQASKYVATEPPQTIHAYFRSLPDLGTGVTYTEQQLAYALAFLMLTDKDFTEKQ